MRKNSRKWHVSHVHTRIYIYIFFCFIDKINSFHLEISCDDECAADERAVKTDHVFS